MSDFSKFLKNTFGVPEINLNDLFKNNKKVLEPEVDRLKQKAVDAVNAAFDHFQSQGAAVVTSEIKDELYKAVTALHLPTFVSEIVTGVILTFDASAYEGQAAAKLSAFRDELVKRIKGAHL